MHTLSAVLVMSLAAAHGASQPVAAQADDHDDSGPVEVGYAVLTPVTPTTGGLTVFETFGFKTGDETLQAEVIPGALVTEASLFASTSDRLGRDLGVAITNPGSAQARLMLSLRRDDGILLFTRTLFVPARRQTASFVTEIFAGQIPAEFSGTVSISSTVPVAILALRFRGTSFSTEPLIDPVSSGTLPVISAGVGGANATLLAHFVSGGGWASEIVVVNTNATQSNVRVDFFKQDGTPMTVRLNGSARSTFFNLTFPARGVFTLAPRDSNGDSRF
jgi:hypothetical protein